MDFQIEFKCYRYNYDELITMLMKSQNVSYSTHISTRVDT